MRKYIIQAIGMKEFREYFRNPATLTMMFMAIGLVILIGKVIGTAQIFMTVLYPLVFLGLYNVAFLFAEEKEKKTLNALLLSPASFGEILTGKLVFHLAVTVLVAMMLVFSFHLDDISVFHTIVPLVVCGMALCLIGTVIGIACPSQSMVGVVTTVFMLLFLMGEALSGFNSIIAAISRALPTHHILKIIEAGTDSRHDVTFFQHYIFLFLFAILVFFWARSFLVILCKQETSTWKFSLANRVTSLVLVFFMCLSSWYFVPPEGTFRVRDGTTYYENTEYGLSIPVNAEFFDMKEMRLSGKLHVTFTLKENKEALLFVNLSKNRKQMSPREEFSKGLDSLKRDELSNLRTSTGRLNGNEYFKAEYSTKNGFYCTYILTTPELMVKIGAKSREDSPETLGILKTELEGSMSKIQLQM